MVDLGLRFSRRRLDNGWCYFVAHRGTRPLDGWVPLAATGTAVASFDPMDGSRGSLPIKRSPDGRLEARLALEPGDSRLLVVSQEAPSGPGVPFYDAAGPAKEIAGTWTVRFVAGGPSRPADKKVGVLESWTRLDDESARAFSGTASYTIAFAKPAGPADAWRLDLGTVHDSARVRLNGRDLGTLIGPAWHLTFAVPLLPVGNQLEVLVTNLAANRAADLDRKDPSWKRFYNVNFAARLPENRGADGLFTAAAWAPLDSGLLGPVTLAPLRRRAARPD
jgi:hypothetical protein